MADSKKRKRRVLDDIQFGEPLAGIYGGDDTNYADNGNQRMTFEDLTRTEHNDCFACQYINTNSMRDNPEFVSLMKLYTENAESVGKESLYQLVKEHFERYCRPMLDVDVSWSIECIREHFTVHTNFPTDEINKQLTVLRSMRDQMISTALTKNTETDEVTPDNNNIRNIVVIQKEIRELLLLKNRINTMVGYNEILDY